ncbi:MAG TPA: HAMP domain-containing sensor histidine kinase [Candidatus Limnocylindrales bacterium]|nr:HAMP domain-containing sensor histidine kinase [Candidatus Limnocylindrales bacterium]
MHRGLRFRLAATLVVLVAVTAAILGIGASAATESVLRDRLQDEATREASFDLSVLVPSALAPGDGAAAFAASGLAQTLRLRGGIGTIVDWGDGDPFLSQPQLAGALDAIPTTVRSAAANAQLTYVWLPIAGMPSLVVGGRPPGYRATFWFVRDVSDVESALTTLRIALLAGGLILVVVGLLVAQRVARGILSPIDSSARAAERIAAGDLSARVPAGGADELGAWARSFNRMAAALDDTVGRLRAAESQNRRFVADVSHELRTPVAALVAEASLVRDGLARGDLRPDERRAAELLVADVGRLRGLVEDLMELSRFDAATEQPRRESVDVRRLVEGIVSARAPDAALAVPPEPLVIETEPRRLDRIVGNLLDNARDHAPGSPVEVRLLSGGADGGPDGVTIAVRDHGPGVDPAALPHLFERFWKADASRATGTSGLGLAIAAEHAALLGGTLRASVPPDGGLLVELRLPPSAAAVSEPLPNGDGAVIGGSEAWLKSEPASSRFDS